ncbi:hypothetical protein [Nesterenkonia pannonica]|uniref:IclR family transcriptional regulator domain-containing protein n=1 Tax=Nesterenkonia pannonica TaxID=1548602 RepID=UPI002164552E|nr:hypothetical protein [Nesterenkonia pannonica]
MLRQAALPQMQELNSLVGQTVQLAVLEDAQVLIVERLSRTGAVTNPAEVGTHMPVHLTSMGHVLLAYSPERPPSQSSGSSSTASPPSARSCARSLPIHADADSHASTRPSTPARWESPHP